MLFLGSLRGSVPSAMCVSRQEDYSNNRQLKLLDVPSLPLLVDLFLQEAFCHSDISSRMYPEWVRRPEQRIKDKG